MPRPPSPPAAWDEREELDELPPLDGDSADAEESGAAQLDETVDVGEDGADDATGEDDPVDATELDLDDADEGWTDGAADAADVDVGDTDLIDIEAAETPGVEVGAEESSIEREADEPSPFDPGDSLLADPGDEGPLDDDEALREQDLPPLDADEDGDDDAGADALDESVADESLGLPWAAQPWGRVGAPLGFFEATALALVRRGALVATTAETGDADLVWVDLEGACEPLEDASLPRRAGAGITALASDDSTVAAVLADGRVLVSKDPRGRFEDAAPGVAVAEAVLFAGALWARSQAGALFVLRPGAREVLRCGVPGTVVSLARVGGTSPPGAADAGEHRGPKVGVRALAVDARGRPLSLVSGSDDLSFAWESIDAPEARVAAAFAARGRYVAYAATRGVVRHEPGAGWRNVRWDGRVTALAFIDDDGALVAATYSDADDTTGLVLVDRDGRASLVARIGAAPRPAAVGGAALGTARLDGHVLAMACDDARGVVWLAGGFGLATFAIRAR